MTQFIYADQFISCVDRYCYLGLVIAENPDYSFNSESGVTVYMLVEHWVYVYLSLKLWVIFFTTSIRSYLTPVYVQLLAAVLQYGA
jgi:hypothetical protein